MLPNLPVPTQPTVLHVCAGGTLVLPATVLCDRQDGGHLVVNPPRPVWERSELAPLELAQWACLVAATGRAMLEVLPALKDGCLNYWEAGNWALNDQAAPVGPKNVQAHRRVHLHVFGRSRQAVHSDWRWGESPKFPGWADMAAWTSQFAPLTRAECEAIAERTQALLDGRFRLPEPGARTA
jgi:diadenosine tetraphosphate (Ap4A) HIT family hydrolase